MSTVKAKKLWQGHVSVRDYLVKEAIEKKEDLTIVLGEKQKTYSYDTLEEHLRNSSVEEFTSKYMNGRKYKLIDFPWE